MDKIVVLDEYKTTSEREMPMKKTKKAPKRRFRLHKLRLLFVLGVFVGVFYLLSSLPIFQIAAIDVEGVSSLNEEKVISLSGIRLGNNFFFLNTWDAKKSLKQNPFVEDVQIRRAFPNKIIITVTERKSVGYLVTSDGYIQVGEDGRLLAIQQTLSNYNLPVISGVDINELPAIGGFIENKKLKQALEILQNCDQSLLDNIAELNVGQDYYILAYTNQKLEVRLGGLDNIEQRLEDLNEILTDIVGTKIAADQILYIDMRYEGSPIIKLRS